MKGAQRGSYRELESRQGKELEGWERRGAWVCWWQLGVLDAWPVPLPLTLSHGLCPLQLLC